MSLAQWGVVLGASLAAALWDMRHRKIPNVLTLPLLASGIVWSAWMGGLTGALSALAGCLVMALPFVVLFIYAGGGAGDAKMMGALGAWLGIGQGLVTLLAVVCVGALLGLAFAASKKKFGLVIGHMKYIIHTWIGRLSAKKLTGNGQPVLPKDAQLTEMPYGLSILCGVLISAVGAIL